MVDFIYYKEHMDLHLKKIIASGLNLDKYKTYLISFINYMETDFDKQMLSYKTVYDVTQVKLENIIDTKYRFLVKGTELRNIIAFMNDLEKRINDFKGKEDNLKVLIGMYFLYYVVITKLVEIFLGATTAYVKADPSKTDYTLRDLGIDMSVLKYYILLEDIRKKTIDDWLKASFDAMEERYISSAIKRILMVYGNIKNSNTTSVATP